MTLQINILRAYYNDSTIGRLTTNQGFQAWTLELPWLGNNQRASCILEGRYEGYIRFSPNQQRDVITLKDVPNRTWINIEVANFVHNVLGCVAVGDRVQYNNGIPMVGNSVATFNQLMQQAKQAESIIVNIRSAEQAGKFVYKLED